MTSADPKCVWEAPRKRQTIDGPLLTAGPALPARWLSTTPRRQQTTDRLALFAGLALPARGLLQNSGRDAGRQCRARRVVGGDFGWQLALDRYGVQKNQPGCSDISPRTSGAGRRLYRRGPSRQRNSKAWPGTMNCRWKRPLLSAPSICMALMIRTGRRCGGRPQCGWKPTRNWATA